MQKRLRIYLILLSNLFILTVFSVPQNYHFDKFPFNEKLPSNSVIRIYNDSEGYMWFGTKDGLCRFDGYDVKVFRSSALTPGKLTNNEIQCIAEDNDKKLWVGTLEGIVIVDKKSYTIKPYENQYLKGERINTILIDKKGNVWIGTSNYGVLRLDKKSGKIERFSTDKKSTILLKGNSVNNIYEDKAGRIWVSLWKNGLCYIDYNRKVTVSAPFIGNVNNPFRFFEDKNGLFWICTWGDGLFTMTIDKSSNMNFQRLKLSKNTNANIDDIVYSIIQDNKENNIWVVTFSGLRVIQKETDGKYTITNANSFFDDDTNKLFHEIVKDRRGNLWIGSVGEGVSKLDFNKLAIQNYSLSEIKTALNIPSYVTHFCETNKAEFYISINRIGLFSFDFATAQINRPISANFHSLNSISAILYLKGSDEIWLANEGEDIIYVFKSNGKSQLKLIRKFALNAISSENTIITLFNDSKGNVWFGTNNGLYLKPINGNVKLIASQFHTVTSIAEDAFNNIWIGTGKEGAFVCTPKRLKNQISYVFTNIKLNIGNYSSQSVQSICGTKKGEIFIGTREGCLFQYDRHKKQALDISGLYGITDEGIMDILEDYSGVLWISTLKRIIRYNPQNHAATYYTNADGLLISSFFKEACIKLNSGLILFGGNKGICSFNPSNQYIKGDSAKQNVAITDILIQNKSIFDENLNAKFNVEKNKITLKSSENNLSIEFSALDYSAANKIQYAYKLSGVEKNWNYVGNNRRFVNYANLPTGNYSFEVRSSDENGSWSDQVTTLNVEILPPFYLSWWAYLIYLAILFIIGNIIIQNIANRIRLRNELKISHIEKEKSEELAQIKLRYFTNISHELLTPLTIILLQIESLQHKNKENAGNFNLIKDNVIRLKRLIQQILVFRKTESGNMKLKIQKDDIVAFINNICQSSFKPLVIEKSINFSIGIENKVDIAYFDPDKLDKIIYNLLSNAFKYTPKKGEIAVKINFFNRNEITIMRLSVSDTGNGIADEDIPNIFKRFYISRSADQSQSHGIGLALTYDLLQLHKGSIEVKSELGEGCVFTIEIPISENAFTPEELSDDIDNLQSLSDLNDILPSDDTEIEDDISQTKDYTLLIVEDNNDLRNLIADNFTGKYHVVTAENGVDALNKVKENEIDMIISDIMMPEMDGLSFCKMIKNDLSTSHITVLMLTAKNSNQDRIDCYNAGADAYIAKPFELNVLKARVKNLLGKRKQKTETFKSNQEINITSMEYCSIDELFLKQAVKKVEEKLADDSFDFDQFALDMASSKSTLHRKLKSLTGLSPGEFIRNVRLKHAVQMLNNNIGNISEIAFAVGFNDPKYFSRCFKIEFGVTPKEFQEAAKSKKT